MESRNLDDELRLAENELTAKIEKQNKLELKVNEDTRLSVKALEDIKAKSDDYENAILEGINCRIGK